MKISLNRGYLLLCMLLCFYIPFIPLAHAASSIIMGCILVLAFFIVDKKQLKKMLSKKAYIIYVVFFLVIGFASVYEGTFIADFSELRKIGQIGLLVILFSFIKSQASLKNAFIAGTILSSGITLIRILLYILETGSLVFYKGEIVAELMMTPRLYLGVFSVISFIFCAELYFLITNKKYKTIYLSAAGFLLLSIFLIASRSAIILVLIALTSILWKTLESKKRNRALLTVMAVALLAFLGSYNLSQRFLYIEDDFRESYIEKVKTHEPRYLIWKSALTIFNESENKISGLGFGKTQELLRKEYKQINPERKRNWFLDRDFNTHNQYLDLLISTGILGLVLFLVFLGILVIKAKDSIYNLNLLIVLILFMCIENSFHRTFGVFVFALILAIILKKPIKQ
ncbi:MAG: O-antigen ligase family protein [Flavobacteriaceae bacterium]|nr:O-antigen ligase family protein [Flavobacteriaceae bacterium]